MDLSTLASAVFTLTILAILGMFYNNNNNKDKSTSGNSLRSTPKTNQVKVTTNLREVVKESSVLVKKPVSSHTAKVNYVTPIKTNTTKITHPSSASTPKTPSSKKTQKLDNKSEKTTTKKDEHIGYFKVAKYSSPQKLFEGPDGGLYYYSPTGLHSRVAVDASKREQVLQIAPTRAGFTHVGYTTVNEKSTPVYKGSKGGICYFNDKGTRSPLSAKKQKTMLRLGTTSDGEDVKRSLFFAKSEEEEEPTDKRPHSPAIPPHTPVPHSPSQKHKQKQEEKIEASKQDAASNDVHVGMLTVKVIDGEEEDRKVFEGQNGGWYYLIPSSGSKHYLQEAKRKQVRTKWYKGGQITPGGNRAPKGGVWMRV